METLDKQMQELKMNQMRA